MAPPPPPPQSAPNHQATVQFLSSMLSQRGPDALPYTEDTKWLIRQHALTLISTYPSLEPKTAIFTHNDGRTVNLLQADGTIPMPFQGVTYNIPVIIWLIESYPRHPPVVYVNPTRDMIIKRPHPHVNPSGLVSAPYLQNWVYPSSNLVDLVRELSSVFGRDPPLYSQRRSPNPNPNPSISNPHNPNFGGSQSSLSHFSNSSSFGSLGPSGYPPPPQPAVARPAPYSPSPYGGGRTEDAAEVFKRNAIGKLVESVNADVSQLAKARSAEMEGLISAQMVLKKRQEDLNNGIKEMLDEKEALERRMQGVVVNTDLLEEWVRKNEGKSKMKGDAVDVDIDNVFECTDVLSKQMLDCTSNDLAIEDVVYSLDKAVQEGVLPFDQYLRTVRLLSREQFFHRATAMKVRGVQMEAHVASMAARASHYAK